MPGRMRRVLRVWAPGRAYSAATARRLTCPAVGPPAGGRFGTPSWSAAVHVALIDAAQRKVATSLREEAEAPAADPVDRAAAKQVLRDMNTLWPGCRVTPRRSEMGRFAEVARPS